MTPIRTPDKIASLFLFIDFLHSNIDTFNQYRETINELETLIEESAKLNKGTNFVEKQKCDALRAEIASRQKVVLQNITNPIKAKAKELNICGDDYAGTVYRNNILEVYNLKENFTKEAIPTILDNKNKYIQFRNETNCTNWVLSFFYQLDNVLKELFSFFNDTDLNEFGTFETKVIQLKEAQPGGINQAAQAEPNHTEPGGNNHAEPAEEHQAAPRRKTIIFNSIETIEKLHSELKGYFPDAETELFKALQDEPITKKLLFPSNQNKLVEVFRRLKYNGFLLNTDTETKTWICSTFQFKKNDVVEPFKECTVWDNLSKAKGEPTKKARICITEWLPYKSPLQLQREAENENI